MKEKIGKFIINTLLGILLLCTIIVGCSFFQMKKNNNKYINIFGYTIMQVATGSMTPTLKVKDIVIVKITKEINNNEIITYEENNVLITHRAIEVTEKNILTKGDANNSIDKPITKENVIGKVVFIIPKIGIWKKVLTTPKVIISGTITICLIYCVSISKDKRKEECIKEKKV